MKAGPYFAFGIGGKVKSDLSGQGYEDLKDQIASAGGSLDDYLSDYRDYDIFKSEEDGGLDAKRFDFGLGVGVTYEINKFFVDLTGEFGLTKLYDVEEGSAPKNMNFSIGVGYKF